MTNAITGAAFDRVFAEVKRLRSLPTRGEAERLAREVAQLFEPMTWGPDRVEDWMGRALEALKVALDKIEGLEAQLIEHDKAAQAERFAMLLREVTVDGWPLGRAVCHIDGRLVRLTVTREIQQVAIERHPITYAAHVDSAEVKAARIRLKEGEVPPVLVIRGFEVDEEDRIK